jgi:Ca2+-binding RTX toxin-like protein
MTDLVTGVLGQGISTLGDTATLFQGCGCSLCQGMREDGNTKLLPNDADRRPEPMPTDPNQANVPFMGVLLPLTRNPDGSYSISGNRNVDATLIGSKWGTQNLTFSFPTDGSQYGANYDSGLNKYHIDLGPLQQAAARAGFAMISSYTNLTFTEGDPTNANIRISQTADNDVGSAQGMFPSDKLPQAGDSWFGRTSQPFYDLAIKGSWGYSTMLHEIGHTMGLKHGHQDYTNLDLSFYFGGSPRFGTRSLEAQVDGQAWSLMSYTPAPGTSGFSGDKANQPQTFMQFDIAALQYMYGANYGTNATDTVYRWSETTGEMFVNGQGQGAPMENKVLLTVWDGDGIDTYDLSNYNNGVVVDLRPGGFTTLNQAQLVNHLAWQSGVAPAVGSVANALLFNNDARSLIENAIGGSGNDRITGNQANNVLDGGAGDDRLEGGLGSDTLIGGAGNDTAVIGGTTGFTVTLNSTGVTTVTQGADVDTLVGIENIVGSTGADTITGDGANNVIEGNGGADTLIGGGGDDRLIGGGFTVVNTTADRPDIVKPAGTDNGSIATAVDTAGTYDLAPRDDVANSTTVPHTTINATATGGTLEHYRIDVTTTSTVTFDIDTKSIETNLDSWIELLNSGGTVIANNDTGASNDPGFTGNDDARLTITLTPGTYYIRVGQWAPGAASALPLTAGQTYSLHISNPSAPADAPTFAASNTSSLNAQGGEGNDFIQGTVGNDTLDGGNGTDTASFATAFSSTSAGVTVSLAVTGAQNTGAAGTDTLISIENLIGSQYNDTLTGNAGANVMEGGAGDDTMDGAAGTDTASYAGAAAGVTVSLGLQGAAQNTGGAGTDTLSNFENLTGSAFADVLTGNAALNTLVGGAGDDVLNGNSAGTVVAGVVDILNGGDGNDVASFATYTASVLAQLDGANSVTVAVGGVNQATLISVEGLIGGQANDRLLGDARANVLSGLAGNDDLAGNDGDDTLDGGEGDDILSGGAGSDTAVFSGSAAVTVDLRLTGAQNTGRGVDTLIGIENLTGGSGNDVLIGNEDANVFTDTGGNDTYIGNGGSDTLSYAGATTAVTVNLNSVAAQNTGGGGTDTIAGIENIIGTALNDTLTGNSEANTFIGGLGSDFLVGNAGNDVLNGGDGSDALVGDANGGVSSADGADVIDGGQGRDTIIGGAGTTRSGAVRGTTPS